jgi:SAM-dependent methyltransferase
MSAAKNCRVCAQPLFADPLLRYRNMPAAAQGFPDARTVAGDAGADLDIYQCSGCGLVQLASEPVIYYREVIRAAGISNVLCAAKRQQFSDFIARHGLTDKKIIEVGCGRGEFLSILDQLPVEAHGIEFSEDSVRHCRDAGLQVSRGYPDGSSGGIPGAPFDAFFLLMFLEHMPDPCASLRVIRDQLAPGGIGLVEVPNFDMMVRECLFSEFISDHLMYFSRDTLISTLRWNGFDVIGTEELRDDYVLSVVVRKRAPLDLSEFARRQDAISRQLREFIAAFPPGRVAVWGAGHQALAVLALSGIASTIRCVVDSAPFKQGKFTPATHLPVVPPAALKSDPVDAVIVMAASYSDEVAGIIAREHGDRVKVAILRENGLEIPGGGR